MKIKLKNKINNQYKIGEIREVEKYLFFPKKINNELRWLEKAIYKQIYTESTYSKEGIEKHFNHWLDLEWVNNTK